MVFITHEDELKLDQGAKVLYFYANWVPLHKKIVLMLQKLEKKYPQLSILAVDLDCFPNLSKRFGLTSLPVLLFFNQGEQIKRITGLLNNSAFNEVFDDISIIGVKHGEEDRKDKRTTSRAVSTKQAS